MFSLSAFDRNIYTPRKECQSEWTRLYQCRFSVGSVQPPAGNLPPRYPKNKEVALSQSLLILALIAVPLSATFHTDANGNFRSIIQKPLPSRCHKRRFGINAIFLILQPKLITEWNLPRDLINIEKHLQEWKCLSS